LGLAVIFGRPLWGLAALAPTDLHSHTLLVPFISAYVLYTERRRLPETLRTSWCLAAGFGVLAFALLALSWGVGFEPVTLGETGPLALQILALVALVATGGLLCFGSAWIRAAAFPMAFLVFMVPLPETVVFHLEQALKLASADMAAWFFDVAGVPVLRDGVFFRLPGITIEVAQECSGIRSSYVLLMTGFLATHFFLRSPWHQAMVIGFVIPLGILRNGFRILVLGWLCVQYGPGMIHSWIHHRGGPVFFVLSLIPLALLLVGLWRLENRRR
jgi:exosortase C (VPDSG-CTERM-specific)